MKEGKKKNNGCKGKNFKPPKNTAKVTQHPHRIFKFRNDRMLHLCSCVLLHMLQKAIGKGT